MTTTDKTKKDILDGLKHVFDERKYDIVDNEEFDLIEPENLKGYMDAMQIAMVIPKRKSLCKYVEELFDVGEPRPAQDLLNQKFESNGKENRVYLSGEVFDLLSCLKKSKEVRISVARDAPIRVENKDFIVVVAPRVQCEGEEIEWYYKHATDRIKQIKEIKEKEAEENKPPLINDGGDHPINEDQKYNGWTNYHTWAVKLHWDNNEADYKYYTEHAKEHKERGNSVFSFGRWLEEHYNDIFESVIEGKGTEEGKLMVTDCGDALDVNWLEIAEAYYAEVEENDHMKGADPQGVEE